MRGRWGLFAAYPSPKKILRKLLSAPGFGSTPQTLREAPGVEMDEAEIAFLAHMRDLAKRGAAATKKHVASQPDYYRALGRRGGQASAASRRARIAAELDGVVEAVRDRRRSTAAPRPPLRTFKELLTWRERPSLNAPPARNRWDEFSEARSRVLRRRWASRTPKIGMSPSMN